MPTLTTSEQALMKAMENLTNTYGKLTRSALTVSEALASTTDEFKRKRMEKEVEAAAKKLGASIDKADGGLLKFVKGLNDQSKAHKEIQASLKKFNSSNIESSKAFAESAKKYLIAAKENGQLQKILGQSYKQQEQFIDEFIESEKHAEGALDRMGAIFQKHGAEFASATEDSVKALHKLNMESKTLSVKEALGDALQKRGGIVGAITDSLRGPNGITSFINFLKAQSAEMLIGGVEKAVRQLIDASNTYYKTGVAPFVAASGRLLLQMTDLQEIMQANKETIFAVQGGAETFNDTLVALQTQTMKLAGMDPILSGKLGAAAQDLTTQLASTTLGAKELGKRSQAYITDITKLRRVTNLTAEQIVEWDNQILNDQEIREGLAKATAAEREQVLANIHQRVEEFQVMGIGIERSKQLAVSFEKLRRQATPVQRIRGAAQLGVLASQVGMSPEDTRKLMLLARKKRNDDEEKEFEKLQMQFGKLYQKRFNELDKAGIPFADALQEMAGRAEEALPGLKAVFDTTRVEGTISGGRARTDEAAQTSLEIKTGVQEAVVTAGHIASWVEQIYKWLSGNGLAGIIMGTFGLILTGGIGKIIGLLGESSNILKGLGNVLSGGKGLGGLGRTAIAGGVMVAGAAGLDYGLGKMGVGGKKIDEAQDEENWKKASTWEKVQSSLPRAIEHVGELVFLDNIVNQARSERIANETAYLKGQGRGGPLAPPTTEKPEEKPTVPGEVAASTGTTGPIESMLVLQQQSKKYLEQIANGIDTLVKSYNDTEAQKMQRLMSMPGGTPLKDARELTQ